MKLLNYVPTVLKKAYEIKVICETEDVEIENLRKNIKSIYDETVIKSASLYGIERFEKIFNIKPLETDSLTTRKNRIIRKMTKSFPYSKKWLENLLDDMVGKGNYILVINYEEYDVLINISGITEEELKIFKRDMQEMLPANMEVDIKIQDATNQMIYFGGFLHLGIVNKISIEEYVV